MANAQASKKYTCSDHSINIQQKPQNTIQLAHLDKIDTNILMCKFGDPHQTIIFVYNLALYVNNIYKPVVIVTTCSQHLTFYYIYITNYIMNGENSLSKSPTKMDGNNLNMYKT